MEESKVLTLIKKQSDTCKDCEHLDGDCSWKYKCVQKVGKKSNASTQVKWCSKESYE